jgi:pimeloyl-ACP methyl ester carboxylesterase
MEIQEREIEVEGVLTRYLTAGDGPPLVLLHGVGDNALDWRWVMPALAHDHRVYAPDLPGSGGNIKPAADHYPSAFSSASSARLWMPWVPSEPRWWGTLQAVLSPYAWRWPNRNA